jgi:membrane peptidoglycan carboxypeptidase
MAYEVAETILRRAVRDGKITSEEMKTLLKQYSEIRE